jgi:mannose-6-phosphate isomerase-like protein (cupin superfamily)
MAAAESDAGATQGVILRADEGDAYWLLGSLTINKVFGDGMTFVDHLCPPGYSPPLHIHHRQDEVFVITEGRFTMTCGDQTWSAEPGTLVFLPRGVPHRFLVSDDGPGRCLIITAPGGFAELVAELGQPADQLTLPGPDVPMPDPERIGAVSKAHGIEAVH